MKRFLSLLMVLALFYAGACAAAEDAERILTINLAEASDEELAEAAQMIKDEQKARLKTTIQFDHDEIVVNRGMSQKVVPALMDIPEGVKAGKWAWASSDETVAICANGSVKGIGPGTAYITCTNILSDETEVSADLLVTCLVPVQSVAPTVRAMEVMAGDPFTIDVVVQPEDATNQEVAFTSSDETIIKVGENGRLEALTPGTAAVTITSTDGTNRAGKLNVTVIKRIGRYDDELTFQGLAWGSSDTDVYNALVDKELVDKNSSSSSYYSSSFYHWPENDLFFANWKSFYSIPVVLEDSQTGTANMNVKLLKKIGGYTPQNIQFMFLNPIGADGQVDAEATELCGVYITYDNEHEPGSEIFTNLLTKMEAQYGEFTRYVSKGMAGRSGRDIYPGIKKIMEGAKQYSDREFQKEMGKDFYLSNYAICTLHGKNNTGIMIMIDTSGRVALFFGKTDVMDRIAELQETLEAIPDDTEDAGI